jgi:ElaB/YqjD/DUF883 family membrane-anchored ribosome-binding protein
MKPYNKGQEKMTTLNNMTNGALSQAHEAAQDFKNKVLPTENSLGKMSHDMGERLGTMASNVSDSASEYVQTGRQYVKENPAKGLAIAMAAGVVAGSLVTLALRRRSHRQP